MANRRWLFPVIGLFVVFSLIWSVGNNRREEQSAWMQGYMAGQMSVQATENGTVVNPLPYGMYPQNNFRGGGPGFFGIIPVLLLGFIGFKMARRFFFRRWQHAGAHGYGGWGEGHHPFEGRGPWGRGPWEEGAAERGGWGRGAWRDHAEGEGRRPERPAPERPTSYRPTDDEVI